MVSGQLRCRLCGGGSGGYPPITLSEARIDYGPGYRL